MSWNERSGKVFLFALVGLFLPLWLWAGPLETLPASPSTYVNDQAGMLSAPQRRELGGFLQELEQKTGVQFLVVTIESLEGESIEDFSLSLAERWRLGRKGKDDGLLFVLAKNDRRYRFESGYGLESLLPDSYLGSVGREILVPALKAGRSGEGIAAAVQAVIGELAKAKNVEITGLPERRARGGKISADFGALAMVLIFVMFMVFSAIGSVVRRAQYGSSRWRGSSLPWWAFLFMGGGRGGRGGGGFGGGGFGGFGGGGGGGFGGGGASGSW